MKFIKILTTVIFSLIILVPVVTFNFTPGTSSEIDNRMLAENPFSAEALANGADLTDSIENYINDRIGFRDEMIFSYTVLNDLLFGKMVHPNYSYGKDSYVFSSGLTTVKNKYSEFHEAFADMVKEIQDYCTDRDVPFLFVFNPAKPAVLSEYIPSGINYDRSWVEKFFTALDERGVRYVDNTKTLVEKKEQGEVVFNQKYDAGHWNDLGAFYGTNAILSELQKDFPSIQLNDLNNFTLSEKLETSLPVSKFPINETVPDINLHLSGILTKTESFKDVLQLHPSYRGFGYYQNPSKISEGSPKALVFQGSYMNTFGYKYLINAFGEYIYVHDYQNVINFPYYYNIFQPDCVIFEVAEYTFSDIYFSYEKMKQIDFNPAVSSVKESGVPQKQQTLYADQINIQCNTGLTEISWNTSTAYKYVWISLNGEVYDMKKSEKGYETTVSTDRYSADAEFEITAYDGTAVTVFQ